MEGSNFHTAIMHSRNIDKLSKMARQCNCSLFVKNGRSQAGLGFGGEGYTSFTIASPTGEGLTTPRSFSRLPPLHHGRPFPNCINEVPSRICLD